eukprot:11217566-Heterocapsa_arctica.AAC.1
MSQTPTSLAQRVKALEAAGKLGDQRPAGATKPGSRAPRAGGWTCPCGKYNFEWRTECLDCQAQKKTQKGGTARTRSSSNRAKKDQGTILALSRYCCTFPEVALLSLSAAFPLLRVSLRAAIMASPPAFHL